MARYDHFAAGCPRPDHYQVCDLDKKGKRPMANHPAAPGGLRHPITKRPLCHTCGHQVQVVSLAIPSIGAPAKFRHVGR